MKPGHCCGQALDLDEVEACPTCLERPRADLTPGQQEVVKRLAVKLHIDDRPNAARCGGCGAPLTFDVGPSLDDHQPAGIDAAYYCWECEGPT